MEIKDTNTKFTHTKLLITNGIIFAQRMNELRREWGNNGIEIN